MPKRGGWIWALPLGAWGFDLVCIVRPRVADRLVKHDVGLRRVRADMQMAYGGGRWDTTDHQWQRNNVIELLTHHVTASWPQLAVIRLRCAQKKACARSRFDGVVEPLRAHGEAVASSPPPVRCVSGRESVTVNWMLTRGRQLGIYGGMVRQSHAGNRNQTHHTLSLTFRHCSETSFQPFNSRLNNHDHV